MIPVYLSHSYRPADADLNMRFAKLLANRTFGFLVDPKSSTFSTAYLELMMNRAAGFVGLITCRQEQPELKCSPYGAFECDLAVHFRKPRLFLVEQGVGERLHREREETYIFDRENLDLNDADLLRKIAKLAERALPHAARYRAPRGSIGVLLPESEGYTSDVIDRVLQRIRKCGFGAELVPTAFRSSYDVARVFDSYDALVLDVRISESTSWVYPFAIGRGIPTIKLGRIRDSGRSSCTGLPPLVVGQLLRDTSGAGDTVQFWHDYDDLFDLLDAQLRHLDRTISPISTEVQVERYFRSLGRPDVTVFVSSAGEDTPLARKLSDILSHWNIRHFHFRTSNDIPLGNQWEPEIEPRVREAQCFVALISRAYLNSEWCRRELDLARQLSKERKQTLIPYYLEDLDTVPDLPQGRTLLSESRDERAERIARDVDEKLRAVSPGHGDAETPTASKGPADAVDVAIVTILPEEYEAVLSCLDTHEAYTPTPGAPNLYAWEVGTVLGHGRQKPYRVVVGLAAQAGNSSNALATRETIARFAPRYAMIVGIAGGLSGQGVGRGDVVVSSAIWGYEYGKLDERGRFKPRPDLTFPVDRPLVRAAYVLDLSRPEWRHSIQAAAPTAEHSPHVHIGPVASGEKVVDRADAPYFAEVLAQWPKLVAVEMEGAGAANAVHEAREAGSQCGFVMVRGISDLPLQGAASPERPPSQTEERDAWKKRAASAAATFAVGMLRWRWPEAPKNG